MKEYHLPASCNFCKSNFTAGNYYNINALAYDDYDISDKGYPVFMDFSVDNMCNLACIMCDASLSSGVQKHKNIKLPPAGFKYDDNFVHQLEPFIPHLKRAIFTGGEPFLISFYYKLWEKMLEMNSAIEMYVTTNGTVYNNKVLSVLEQGKFNITVSVDSFIKEVYEQIRLGAVFENTLQNIYAFSDYCKNKGTQFTVIICPMQNNWSEIPAIVERCNSNGWQFTYNILLKPWQVALWSLPSKKLKEIQSLYKNVSFSKPTTDIQLGNIKKFEALIELLGSWHNLIAFIEKEDPDLNATKYLNNKEKIADFYLLNNTLNPHLAIDNIRLKSVLNKVPPIIFQDDFCAYLEGIASNLLCHEFMMNDEDTIADHLTIVGFNILMGLQMAD